MKLEGAVHPDRASRSLRQDARCAAPLDRTRVRRAADVPRRPGGDGRHGRDARRRCGGEAQPLPQGEKFDANGRFLAKWGSSGAGEGQFAGPSGVATDASGNVYVADQSNNRVQKFSCP
jgi:hypothetical protein